jgi:hypothetical protein
MLEGTTQWAGTASTAPPRHERTCPLVQDHSNPDQRHGPIDRILSQVEEFPVPDADNSLPAYLELSDDAWVPIEGASRAQLRLSAKLHREIARRHNRRARLLEALAKQGGES